VVIIGGLGVVRIQVLINLSACALLEYQVVDVEVHRNASLGRISQPPREGGSGFTVP
jgi:hypothetical protein